MTWILIWIAITSIWVLGITIATQEGMVFYKLREWAQKKGMKIFEPIVLCIWCMPSIHSFIGYFFCVGTGLLSIDWHQVIAYPIVVSGSSLVSGIVWTWYKKLEVHWKHLTNIERISFYDLKDRRRENWEKNNK